LNIAGFASKSCEQRLAAKLAGERCIALGQRMAGVSNFFSGVPKTADYVEAAFGDGEDRVRRVQGPPSGSWDGSGRMWRSSVFKVEAGRRRV